MSTAKVIIKFKIDNQPKNILYWQNKPFEERLIELELIRKDYTSNFRHFSSL